MSRRQAYVIIALLAVVAVTLAVMLGYLLGSGTDREPDTAADLTTSSSSPSATTTSPTVAEHRQTSAVQPTVPPAVTVPLAPPAPPVPVQPTFVRCVTGLASMGIYSDGSTRPDNRCPEPGAARAEGVCGGLYGWQEVSREEYIDLCGGAPPSGG